MTKTSHRIPLLTDNPYLEELLAFLEKVVQEEDVMQHPYEVCIDCRKVAPLDGLGHERQLPRPKGRSLREQASS